MVSPPIFFSVNRGVRQGDPLSPLLFTLSLEILACYIRQDRNIQGLVIKNEEIILTLFGDDMTCFLRDRLSYLNLFVHVILKLFSSFSGLRVNDDKTELFAIGPQKLVQEEFYHNTCTSIKIFGIYFIIIRQREGIQTLILFSSPLKKTLNMWRW